MSKEDINIYGDKKPEGGFMKFLRKLGVTNPLLQVALPVVMAVVVVTVASCAIFSNSGSSHGIKTEVTVTYDTPLSVDLFAEDGTAASDLKFVSDVSVIDMSQIASYKLTVANGSHKVSAVLNVIDDVPPTADPVPQTVYSLELPDPNLCVTNIQDKSEVTVTYAEGTDISAGGTVLVDIVLTDFYGNKSVVQVPFECTSDANAPIILGAHDFEFMAGMGPDLLSGVTATDDMDPNPTLIADDSDIDYMTPGVYPLLIIAADKAGNETAVTVNVTVIENDGSVPTPTPRPSGGGSGGSGGGSSKDYSGATTADAYAAARKVYNSVCNSSMSDVLKGLKLFRWVNRNIAFNKRGVDHTSWAAAACQAFGNRRSSCYGQWAACKALCDVAGIPNRKVWRSGSSRVHVWCLCYLNGGWYHCDATQGYFSYMMTDAEIKKAPGQHNFINSNLPARSTISVQKYINYSAGTIKPGLVLVTPTPTPIPTESPETPPPTAGPTSSPSTSTPTAKPTSTAPATATAAPTTAAETTAASTTPAQKTDTPADNTTEPPEDGQGGGE